MLRSRWFAVSAVGLSLGLCAVPSFAQNEPPADAAGAEPEKLDLVLPEEPKTPEELVRAVSLTLKLARPELARRYMDALVKMEPDDDTLLQLRDKFGTALFIEFSRNNELKPVAGQLLDRMTEAGNRRGPSAARMEQLIGQLSGTDRQRELAILELQHLGPHAVGPIVQALSDPDNTDKQGMLAYVMTRLGPATVPPLLAMLDADNVSRQSLAAEVLGSVGDKNDELPLLIAAFSPAKDDRVQLSARQALARILYKDVLKTGRLNPDGLAERIRRTAADYLAGRIRMPAGDNGLVTLWTWNKAEGVPQENRVSAKSAALFKAEQLTRQALDFSPADRAIQTQLLSILLLRDVEQAGWAAPLPEGPGTAHNLLLMSGPELAADVLKVALEQRNIAAAVGALRVMAQNGSVALLRPTNQQKSPVVAALDDTDPRVQFSAATAILSWDPVEPFPGARRVVEILARELNSDEKPNMVIVDPNYPRGDEFRSLLQALGYDAAAVRTGAEGFNAAAARGDMAVAVLHLNTIRPDLTPTIAQFRADSRTASIPIVIYGPAAMRSAAYRLIREYDHVAYLQEASTPGELQIQLTPFLAELTPPPLTAEQRDERVKAAAYWLRHIAEGRREKIFDLGPAEEALTASITKPEIGGDVLVALASIGRPSAQRELAEVARTNANPAELRALAARNLAYHIQKHGLTLSNDEVRALYDIYEGEQDATVRSALAAVIGSFKPDVKTIEARIRAYPVAERPLPTP